MQDWVSAEARGINRGMIMDETMLIVAELMSDKYGKIKITTYDGREIIGVSWGIQPAHDEDNEELECNCIAINCDNGAYVELTNEEIKAVEKV